MFKFWNYLYQLHAIKLTANHINCFTLWDKNSNLKIKISKMVNRSSGTRLKNKAHN